MGCFMRGTDVMRRVVSWTEKMVQFTHQVALAMRSAPSKQATNNKGNPYNQNHQGGKGV